MHFNPLIPGGNKKVTDTIIYYIILYSYCTILYYTILYYTILYYTILNLTVKYAFGDFFKICLLQCFYWLNINSPILVLTVTFLCIYGFFFKEIRYNLTNTFTCNLCICKNSEKELQICFSY